MRHLDREAAQSLWDAIMWCCTRRQLREVGQKIRQDWAATPEQRAANEGELTRLRKIYEYRRETLIDPR